MNSEEPSAAPEARPRAEYRNGLAVLHVVREAQAPGWMRFDPRLSAFTAPGQRMPELLEWLRESGGDPHVERETAPIALLDVRSPREYQSEALARWRAAGERGSVVLPTGAGKSFIAILAIHATGGRACVVAPTRALVAQWYAQLADAFGRERVGAFYGDEKDPAPITVTTYHSAFALLERCGAGFELLVLDEVHHLADDADGGERAWHDILHIAPSRARLGLTATYPDGRDRAMRRGIGGVVYRRSVREMTDAELAGLVLERRFVALSPEEADVYHAGDRAYRAFLEQRGYADRGLAAGDAWRIFMAETRTSPTARRALRAFRERERIVALCGSKLREAGNILRLFPAETAVLFCGSATAAQRVSRYFAVPMITARTPASERHQVLSALAGGEVRAVASVRVLDEGWDVPAAKLGIILGDDSRGSPRQFQQRLGRILRRQGDAVASMFEVVAAGTHEFFASQKRRAPVRRDDGQLGLGL